MAVSNALTSVLDKVQLYGLLVGAASALAGSRSSSDIRKLSKNFSI